MLNMNLNSAEFATETLLRDLGFDLHNENFRETPARVGRFWKEFIDRPEPNLKTFDSKCLNIVSLQGYETWGLCPHHLLPVKYTAHISYTPKGKVFGISKLPRIFDYILRTLPLQEDIPHLVVDFIKEKLQPSHVSCQVKGMHLCMVMRGVKAKDCTLLTSADWWEDLTNAEHKVPCK